MPRSGRLYKLTWWRVAVALILLPLLCYLLILASKSLPQGRYIYQINQAINQGDITSNNYTKIPQGFTDNWSNCSSLIQGTRGYPIDVFEASAIGVYLGECPELVSLSEKDWDGSGVPTTSFDQYWHGYQIIGKSFVTTFGYSFTTTLLLVGCILLLIIFLRNLRLSIFQKILFCISLGLITDFLTLYPSIPQAIWQFSALLIPLTLGELYKKNVDSRKILVLSNFCAGFLSWYFDFGFALGVSLIIWIYYVFSDEFHTNSLKYARVNFLRMIVVVTLWLSGAFASIFSHTVIVGLFRGFSPAFSHILSRFSDDTLVNDGFTLFSGVSDTFSFTMKTDFFFLWLILMVLLFSSTAISCHKFRFNLNGVVTISFMSGITLFYLIATSSVSSHHAWLAQRIWGWLFTLSLTTLAGNFYFSKLEPNKMRMQREKR